MTSIDPLDFAIAEHGDQMYGDGQPYWTHLKRVAAHFEPGTILWKAAFLHDVLEDTKCTEEKLRTAFGSEVYQLVNLLTKRIEIPDDQYYSNIKENLAAMQLKLADLADNLAHCVINFEAKPEESDWLRKATRYSHNVHYLTTGEWLY